MTMFRLATWAALTLAAWPGAASAMSYVMMSDDALLQESEGVLTATVLERLASADSDQETRYVLQVGRVLAGAQMDDLRLLALPGTFDSPNINFEVPGVPEIRPGAELLLFYSARADGTLQPQQLLLGLFEKTKVGGRQVYVRHLEQAAEVAAKDRGVDLHAPRLAAEFEGWISAAANHRAPPATYLAPMLAPGLNKFTVTQFTNLNTPAPGRWFEFDSDQALVWKARPDGQSNTTSDEFGSLQAALAGWSNDATSRISMSYGGTADAAASCSVSLVNGNAVPSAGCFSGFVKWNDPDGQIAGSYTSGGTLAFGGSATSNSLLSTFGGSPWYRRILGFVTVQDGAGVGAVMDGNAGADGIELLTHEVGHAIGLGHSCELGQGQCSAGSLADAATMRSTIHRDGRGATLGVDDIAGAAAIYPMPAPANVGPTVSANTPSQGSTTALGGGAIGALVSTSITFSVSGGSGSGTTSLVCAVSSGTVTIVSGTPQTLGVGGSAAAVSVRFTLDASPQTGGITCTATPQGGQATQLSYSFTASAGAAVCDGDCRFRNGFE